jgi:hypothetical protein
VIGSGKIETTCDANFFQKSAPLPCHAEILDTGGLSAMVGENRDVRDSSIADGKSPGY